MIIIYYILKIHGKMLGHNFLLLWQWDFSTWFFMCWFALSLIVTFIWILCWTMCLGFLLYHWTKWVFLGLANGDRECGFCCLFFPTPTMKDFTLFYLNIDCFLQTCLFCMVLHLASPFLLLEPNPPTETVASYLQYRKAWPLDLEKAMFVSSFWNLILEPLYWPGGLRGHCLLFSVNRTFA